MTARCTPVPSQTPHGAVDGVSSHTSRAVSGLMAEPRDVGSRTVSVQRRSPDNKRVRALRARGKSCTSTTQPLRPTPRRRATTDCRVHPSKLFSRPERRARPRLDPHPLPVPDSAPLLPRLLPDQVADRPSEDPSSYLSIVRARGTVAPRDLADFVVKVRSRRVPHAVPSPSDPLACPCRANTPLRAQTAE